MKLVFIYQYLSIGGVEVIIRNRIKFLPKSYLIDLIFLYDISSNKIFDKLNVNKVYVERNLKKIKSILLENNYEIIISIDTPQIHDILEIMKNKTKIVLEIHTGYHENREYIRKKNIPKNTKLIIVPSNSFKNVVEKEIDNFNIPIKKVSNCIDKSFFVDYSFNFENIKPIPILWVGRLDSLKNWFECIKIFDKLIKKIKDREFELIIIGGYKSDILEINKLKQKLEELKLKNKIIWLPFVEYDFMPKIYKIVSKRKGFLISTSKFESFGMTVAESMASKCPVIASNIDAYKELLDDGKGGFLYELGNIEDAVNKINLLINNKDIREEKINYSFNKALKLFDPEKNTEEWLNIINNEKN